jgi:hypothetical protein
MHGQQKLNKLANYDMDVQLLSFKTYVKMAQKWLITIVRITLTYKIKFDNLNINICRRMSPSFSEICPGKVKQKNDIDNVKE